MNKDILTVLRILEEEKASIRGKTEFEHLTLTQKQRIEMLDRVHQKIVKEVALKNER